MIIQEEELAIRISTDQFYFQKQWKKKPNTKTSRNVIARGLGEHRNVLFSIESIIQKEWDGSNLNLITKLF